MQSLRRSHPRLLGLMWQHDHNSALVAVALPATAARKTLRRGAHAQATRPPRDPLYDHLEK